MVEMCCLVVVMALDGAGRCWGWLIVKRCGLVVVTALSCSGLRERVGAPIGSLFSLVVPYS